MKFERSKDGLYSLEQRVVRVQDKPSAATWGDITWRPVITRTLNDLTAYVMRSEVYIKKGWVTDNNEYRIVPRQAKDLSA